ncbi:DUF4376 domain-containing protein [Pseudomonas sp. F(2018)]|uniref:DUF4376 domain-containing protein n=1 Tax=Pseudomonas sp. F(2018) TaxID=2502240 RepID=UPI0010F51FF6|nr:DUF4376 domain-containing protein [Pseudomonas sp. F(2018)]
MKFYRDPDSGTVFAYEADGSQDEFIPGHLVVMSEAEIQAHLNPVKLPTSADVDAERDRRIDAGVEFQGVQYQSRGTDRENIAGAAQLGFMAIVGGAQPGDLRWSNPDQDFAWIASDNSMVLMDAPTVVAFGKVAAVRKQALIYAGRQLKDMESIPSDFTDDKWWQ